MDGTALNGGNPTGTQFSISPVDRGSHTLQAVVRDAAGNLCARPPASPSTCSELGAQPGQPAEQPPASALTPRRRTCRAARGRGAPWP